MSHTDPNTQGVTDERYRVIPRTLVFLTTPTRVLLLKGAANKRLWAGRYNGLGGHIERGEDVLHAALREVEEEAGIAQVHLHLCGTVMVDTGMATGVLLFIFRGFLEEMAPVTESQEGKAEWILIDEVVNYPLVDDLFVLLPRVLAWEPGHPVFHARVAADEGGGFRVQFSN